MDERCETCRFWKPNTQPMAGKPAGEKLFGECRVRAPAVMVPSTGVGLWPSTHTADWCGEWRAAKVDTPAPALPATKNRRQSA